MLYLSSASTLPRTLHLRIFVLYYNCSIGAIRVIILWEKQSQCYLSTAIPTIVVIDTFFIPRFAEIKTWRSFLPCGSAKQASLFCSHSLRQFWSYQCDRQYKPFVVEHSLLATAFVRCKGKESGLPAFRSRQRRLFKAVRGS